MEKNNKLEVKLVKLAYSRASMTSTKNCKYDNKVCVSARDVYFIIVLK